MVTTLLNNSTSDRFVSRVSMMPIPMSPMSTAVAHAGSHFAFVAPAVAPTTTTSPTNRWLGGIDGLGCGSTKNAYGTKRIHPGCLGGVT